MTPFKTVLTCWMLLIASPGFGQSPEPETSYAADQDALAARDALVAQRRAYRLFHDRFAEKNADEIFDILSDAISSERTVDGVVAGALGAPTAIQKRLIQQIITAHAGKSVYRIVDLTVREEALHEHGAEVLQEYTESARAALLSSLSAWIVNEDPERAAAAVDLARRLGLTELIPIAASSLFVETMTGAERPRFASVQTHLGYIPSQSASQSLLVGTLGIDQQIAFIPQVVVGENRGFVLGERLLRTRGIPVGGYSLPFDVTTGVLVNDVAEPDLRFAAAVGTELVIIRGERRVAYRPEVLEALIGLAKQLAADVPDFGYDEIAWVNWFAEETGLYSSDE